MKFDISVWKKHFPKILEIYEEKGFARCEEICIASGYPLIMVYTVLNREYGGLADKIESLKKFYGYTEIKG